jgi:Tfp pilus assembly protein PilF
METLLAQKNYAAALKPAQRIVEILPNNADAHLSLANIYFYVGQIALSEGEYNAAIKINPIFVVAYTNLGQLYQSQKKWDLAEQQFQHALQIDPNNADAKRGISTLPAR